MGPELVFWSTPIAPKDILCTSPSVFFRNMSRNLSNLACIVISCQKTSTNESKLCKHEKEERELCKRMDRTRRDQDKGSGQEVQIVGRTMWTQTDRKVDHLGWVDGWESEC